MSLNHRRYSTRPPRGLGLCSGGLDSMLAALLLRRQGVEVEWVTFATPFFSSRKAEAASRQLDIPLIVQDITETYLEMLANPRCGYGQHMNPCMDCHALMFKLAGRIMTERGFDFLFSGEVLGQRPMSQTRPSLRYVEKHSGYAGYILRPLSAKRLPQSVPETEGLVDRDSLMDLAGRSRKPQIRLAAEFGITTYPAPAGGCLLTDKGFSARLQDLFAHQDGYTRQELELLKHGRHFRLSPLAKLVVGRTQEENQIIAGLRNPEADTLLKVKNHPGPTALLPFAIDARTLSLAASICASYSKAPDGAPSEVVVTAPSHTRSLTVISLPPRDFKHLLL